MADEVSAIVADLGTAFIKVGSAGTMIIESVAFIYTLTCEFHISAFKMCFSLTCQLRPGDDKPKYVYPSVLNGSHFGDDVYTNGLRPISPFDDRGIVQNWCDVVFCIE